MFANEDYDQPRGHYLVCIELGENWHEVDFDILVRCLCYIGRHAAEITPKASGLEFEVISLQWHHYGSSYPSLALPCCQGLPPKKDTFGTVFALEEPLNRFVKAVGLDKIAELSAEEPMTWADINDTGR